MELYEVTYFKKIIINDEELDEYAHLGIYSSKRQAKEAIKKLLKRKKFKNSKEHIYIQKVGVDESVLPWEGGFVTG